MFQELLQSTELLIANVADEDTREVTKWTADVSVNDAFISAMQEDILQ
jgi:hypothetical protein